MNVPAIGTTIYMVHEHLYYIPDHAAPIMEYVVGSGRVTKIIKGGYTEIRVTGKSPAGFTTPYYYKVSDIGQRCFLSEREAALKAKEMTEQYEHTWGWLGPPEIPMRRPWESILTEAK